MAMQMVLMMEQLMVNLLETSLGCLLVERMVMQMVEMLEIGLVLLSEKHLGQMMVMKSVHL